jgi:hypothetical protein
MPLCLSSVADVRWVGVVSDFPSFSFLQHVFSLSFFFRCHRRWLVVQNFCFIPLACSCQHFVICTDPSCPGGLDDVGADVHRYELHLCGVRNQGAGEVCWADLGGQRLRVTNVELGALGVGVNKSQYAVDV